MIKANDQVFIKAEFQDPGDEQLTWFALEDEDGGRVLITPTNLDMGIRPTYKVPTYMLEA